MLSIRRPWWAALVLAGFAGGCSSEPAATNPDTTPTPTVTTSATTPETPPPAPPAENKDGMKAEMATEPKSAEPAKPADEQPKIDGPGLQIEAPKVEPPNKDDKPKSADADAGKLSDEEVAEIKKLPADEQPVALKQMVCPVSDEHLGGMGVPVKVSAEGKTFYLCCKSCKKEVDKNPKDVVAKLAAK